MRGTATPFWTPSATSSRADAKFTDEGIATLALLLSGLLLLGGRSLSSLQSFFSFSPRISQGCNASRQSSDILSGRCQLVGKDFTSLALLLSGLLLLGGRSWQFAKRFRRIQSGRCDASRQSSDILSRRCQLTDKDFASLALLLSGLLLLGSRSLGSLQSFQLQSAHQSGL